MCIRDSREAAQAELAAALASMADYAPAQLANARMKAVNQNFDEAQTIVDQVLAKNPKNHDALLLSGMLQAAKGNPDNALALYRKAIEAKPDFLMAHSAIISSLFSSKNSTKRPSRSST